MKLSLIAAIILAVMMATFAIQNTQQTQVKIDMLELYQRLALLEKNLAEIGRQSHNESSQQTGTIPL